MSVAPVLSVVVPVCNEAENVGPLAREIGAALAQVPHEILFVDDGSTDATARAVLDARAGGIPEVRLLRHSFRAGQSAAVSSGVRAAQAEWVGTLDGDGQNDPADLPKLLAAQRDPANHRGVCRQQGGEHPQRRTDARGQSRLGAAGKMIRGGGERFVVGRRMSG